jgi:hypothetical protein
MAPSSGRPVLASMTLPEISSDRGDVCGHGTTQPVKAINENAAVVEATNLETAKPEFMLLASANSISRSSLPSNFSIFGTGFCVVSTTDRHDVYKSNVAHHWWRTSGDRHETKTECRRPVHVLC